MSTSTHKIAIKGADHTAAAFQSIQARAALLKTIAENTKQTAEQTGETLYQTDLD